MSRSLPIYKSPQKKDDAYDDLTPFTRLKEEKIAAFTFFAYEKGEIGVLPVNIGRIIY